MDHQSFVTTVHELANIPADEAERVSCFVLYTLAQRISLGEAEDLAERLPPDLRPCLDHDGLIEKFHLEDFLSRIEEHLGVDRPAAGRWARAVSPEVRSRTSSRWCPASCAGRCAEAYSAPAAERDGCRWRTSCGRSRSSRTSASARPPSMRVPCWPCCVSRWARRSSTRRPRNCPANTGSCSSRRPSTGSSPCRVVGCRLRHSAVANLRPSAIRAVTVVDMRPPLVVVAGQPRRT